MDLVVVFSSRRMTYLAAEDINLEVARGMFWIVPQTGELLRVIVTCVPGGKGSAMGSV